MKKTYLNPLSIALAALTLPAVSLADLRQTPCPRGSNTLHACVSAPVSGDRESATRFLDAVSVCEKSGRIFLILKASGMRPHQEAATVLARVGGTTYEVRDRTDPTVLLQFSISRGNPRAGHAGLLNLHVDGNDASSHYSCD